MLPFAEIGNIRGEEGNSISYMVDLRSLGDIQVQLFSEWLGIWVPLNSLQSAFYCPTILSKFSKCKVGSQAFSYWAAFDTVYQFLLLNSLPSLGF